MSYKMGELSPEGTNYLGYEKIPLSSSRWKEIPKDKNMKWYVTEKVHGSCFCFIYFPQTQEIKFAKRSKLLRDDEYFFGFRDILGDLLPKLQHAFHLTLDIIRSPVTKIMIYGELFGGSYPNISSSYKPVQSGIYYSPNIHFYAFDISYEINEKEAYIDFERSIEIFRQSSLFFAEPLASYTNFQKAAQYKIGFNSTIPRKLGLPDIGANKAEGIVVRSGKGHYLLKIKIPEFSESKYDDNDYDEKDQTDPIATFKRLAVTHMTENRLNNAISKVGEFDKNQEEIFELFVDDILLEINGFHIQGLREYLLEEANKRFR